MADPPPGAPAQSDEPEPHPRRPLLIYDGQCPFCCRWVQRWRHTIGTFVDDQPYQEAAARFPNVDPEAFAQAVHLTEPDGRITRGAGAIFLAFSLAHRRRELLWAYENLPGFAAVSEWVYALIAAHRGIADRIDRLLLGPGSDPSAHRLTRQIFLRLLGIIYAIAFLSLWVQIDGLIGSKGILPIHSFLEQVRAFDPEQRYWLLPTLCWLNPGDGFLHFLCAGGVVASLLLIAGIAQLPALIILWLFYLSLTVAGQDFLSFQWDALLLEAGFLAIFFAPWQFLPSRSHPPASRIVLWLLRWLLFRVMFMSGVVKLASGDPSWRAWTALRYHYMTQPLPTWIGWYFFHLPAWFQTLSCGVVFFVELLVPPLIFAPRRLRLAAFWIIILFQLLIAATGNYGFFNLLAIVLCCTLPDDAFWRWFLRRRQAPTMTSKSPKRFKRLRWPAWITAPLASILLAVTIPLCIAPLGISIAPSPLIELQRRLDPFRIANSYGLFAVMTTTRPEIIVQGSNDGQTWKDYSFKWKPGDLDRPPAFTTPHMPRLDWQMWFAALGQPADNPWLDSFLAQLLHGSPPVLGLLQSNPFPGQPPRYVRAVLYDYRFTSLSAHRATGAWWRRKVLGIYDELERGEGPDYP